MISIDINMRMWFDYTSIKDNDNIDDIFGTTEEYIKTNVKIKDIRVVNE